MKHYSAAALHDLVAEPLKHECDLVEQLAHLVARRRRGHQGKAAARPARIGVKENELSRILRGQMKLPAGVAAKLGYRLITGFERIRRPVLANRGRSAERVS